MADLRALLVYADSKADRRHDLLEQYIARLQRHGRMEGNLCTIDVEYYKAPRYGRAIEVLLDRSSPGRPDTWHSARTAPRSMRRAVTRGY